MDGFVSIALNSVQQHIDSESWKDVEGYILENHYSLFSHGLHKDVNYWISCLPDNIRETPEIQLQLAYSLIPFQEKRSFRLFSETYNLAIDNKNSDLAFQSWTGLALCSFYNLNRFGEFKAWIDKMNFLLKTEPLPTEEKPRNAFIAAYFNALLFCSPDKKRLLEWQTLAQGALNSSSNPETRILLFNHLIMAAIWQGDMFQARMLSQEFLGIDEMRQQNPLAFMVQKIMQSQIAWLNVDLEESLFHVKDGLTFSEKKNIHVMDPQLCAQEVFAYMAAHDFKNAELSLKKLERIKNPHHILDNAQYHYLRGWLAVSIGDIEMAYSHAKRAVELTTTAGVEFTEAAARVLLAQVHFEKKNIARSLHYLARAQLIGRHMGSLHVRYAGLLAQSWAMFQFKRNFLALRYLRKAFAIGAEEGYYHIPGWPFKIMNHLCEVALREGIEPNYTKKLIRLHEMVPSEPFKAPDNWPWKIQIKLFGQFRLFIDGVEWLPSRKSQQRPLAILKLLAFNTGGIHQETLADILWADSEGDSVIQTLHTTLHRLRKLIGSHEVIVLKNGILRLNAKLVHVDVASFQMLCQEKLDNKKTMSTYREIDQYYSQGILLGETETSWLIPIRDKIKMEFLNFLYRVADFMEQRGDRDNSIHIYQQAITVNDCVERSYQKLIQLYIDEGLHAEAMHTYEQCKSALKQRYKISPSFKTEQLIVNL